MGFQDLEFDLTHEMLGGHDIYTLGYAGGSCMFCVDFGHDYRRSAAFLAHDVESARTFIEVVARDVGFELAAPRTALERPGAVDALLVGESEDDNGDRWQTIRVTFSPAVELEFKLGVSRKTATVASRVGSDHSAVLAWMRCLFVTPVAQTDQRLATPDWVDPRPLTTRAEALPERFSSRVVWAEDVFVGVAEDPGLLLAHDDVHGIEIVFETRQIAAIASAGRGVVIVHEDEHGQGIVSIIRDVDMDELEIDELYRTDSPLPPEALLVSPDNALIAFAIPGRLDARFATLVIDREGREIDCIEDGWPVGWGAEGLSLRGVDGEGALLWLPSVKGSQGAIIHANASVRELGPWTMQVEDGLVRLGEAEFISDGVSTSRLRGRSYQALGDGWCVFNWSRPYLVDVASGVGWPLLPLEMSAQNVMVSPRRDRAFVTIDGVSFALELRHPNDVMTSDETLRQEFARDRFHAGSVATQISLAEVGRWHNLEPSDVKRRLDQAAQDFVTTRMRLVREALQDGPDKISAIGADHAAAWALLVQRMEPEAWQNAFEQGLYETFAKRLDDDKFLEFAIHGGVIPGEHVGRVQEALAGAKRLWLQTPHSPMQGQVALAIDVAVEVLGDFRESPVPSNLWKNIETRMRRVHELLTLGAPEVVGLGETIELLRSIESMATR